ncbi:MAG: hypothetical protein AMXMBFR82_24780 [Candidatus Hydrogenedentota bacterium]
MRHMMLMLAGFCLTIAAAAQNTGAAPGPEIVVAEPGATLLADEMGFLRVRAIRGPDWEIEKVRNPEGVWIAELRSRGAKVMEFADCGEREEWMRFMLWPIDAADPDLLLVLRYSGGIDGSDALDIIHLKNNFRTLLRSAAEFKFHQVTDLNGDAWPEVVGASRHYAYFLDLPRELSPFPTVILSYRPDAKKYQCQNHRFPDLAREKAEIHRKEFEQNQQAAGTFAYDRWNQNSRQALASLVSWILGMCYRGESEVAWAYLHEFTTPETANLIQPVIAERLATEPYYQEVLRTQARDSAPQN